MPTAAAIIIIGASLVKHQPAAAFLLSSAVSRQRPHFQIPIDGMTTLKLRSSTASPPTACTACRIVSLRISSSISACRPCSSRGSSFYAAASRLIKITVPAPCISATKKPQSSRSGGIENSYSNDYYQYEEQSTWTTPDLSWQKGEGATWGEDWRGFRARLCVTSSGAAPHGRAAVADAGSWAHEIAGPEEGCVLVATRELERHPLLAGSVVFLSRAPDPRHRARHAPFRGFVVNRRLPFQLDQLDHVDPLLSLALATCPAFLGGALSSTSSFHLVSAHCALAGFRTPLPGFHVGDSQAALLSTCRALRLRQLPAPHVRIHVGQMEWDWERLEAEMRLFGWWKAMSCSPDLLLEDDLWNKLTSHDLFSY